MQAQYFVISAEDCADDVDGGFHPVFAPQAAAEFRGASANCRVAFDVIEHLSQPAWGNV
jgi:hypothetical protein